MGENLETSTLVIGVDGGQTGTRASLVTLDGEVLGIGEGGGLIHFSMTGSREVFVRSVGGAIGEAWAKAGLQARPVAAIGLGLSGVEADTPEDAITRELLPQFVQAGLADVQNDGLAALAGAHVGGPGIIIIAGTGCIVHGMNAAGQRARVGGWGWLVGDEGAAVTIGREAMRATFRSSDGTAPQSALEGAFCRHFGVTRTYDLKRLVYATDFGARGFGLLAPIVAQTAEEGDAVANELLIQAGKDLAHNVITLAGKLIARGESLPVAPIGGVFTHIRRTRETFIARLHEAWPELRVIAPTLPPVLGAAIMAMRLVYGHAPIPSQTLERLSAG